LRSAHGVGGAALYLVTMVQMLLLAAVVAPYVFVLIYLGGEDEH
jgi:hypothetical protein